MKHLEQWLTTESRVHIGNSTKCGSQFATKSVSPGYLAIILEHNKFSINVNDNISSFVWLCKYSTQQSMHPFGMQWTFSDVTYTPKYFKIELFLIFVNSNHMLTWENMHIYKSLAYCKKNWGSVKSHF